MKNLRALKFFPFSFLIFIFSGCQLSVANGLNILNDNLGKALNNLSENQASSTFNFFSQNGASTKNSAMTSADLSAANKQAIDDWLTKKGLNRYGDAGNAVYTGGTPLFNEATGKSIERYDYILNKFPDILNLIKEGK
ncbi:MAG: hypothetical protein PHO56_00905 [Patescibacteria group bacterium]|nr:hypothetical protein [Patescibacteria group bacterium]